ncbi:hypothetical protein [Clostridium sp.]|uniref:hypothetical protein n=1 Tax=Clostridium sp. TaxID=1506 RepID=UPI001A45C82A|nr:hypothetical protein [Clostridium sp.]MBK5242129.1 hypothetical protein [Clostridium sp.]
MSKYVESLIKGNQTLESEVKLLRQENQELQLKNHDLIKDNYNLKQSRSRLQELSCHNKNNCPLINNELFSAINLLGGMHQYE